MTSPSSPAGAGPEVAEQFETIEQQREANLIGMWLFLATEGLLFSGIFVAYAVYFYQFTPVFAEASLHLHWLLAGANTAILLTSGLTIALAEQTAAEHRRKLTLILIATTMALGLAFMAMKGYEYHAEYKAGLIPFLDQPFDYSGENPQQAALFYNLYFALTGLHALHMIIGLGLLGVIFCLCMRWRDPYRVSRQVQIAGMYWAFVDIVWIFVYTGLYLLGR